MRRNGGGASVRRMKRALFLLAFLTGVAGCGAQMVMGPDGYPAYYIRCHGHRPDRCYAKAQRTCPYGYHMVEQPGYGQLLIRCN